MRVLANVGQLATCRPEGSQGDIHVIPNAALAWDGEGTITWVGPERDLPLEYTLPNDGMPEASWSFPA
jgi:hypothetical protein